MVGVLLVGVGACSSDTLSPSTGFELADPFLTVPTGFDEVSSSFGATDGNGVDMWIPQRAQGRGHGMGLMGGGLGPEFLGAGPLFGRGGFGHGPFGGPFGRGNCVYSAATGISTCTEQRRELTITRFVAYATADGTPQARPDSTTDRVRVQTTVEGTVNRRGTITSVVAHHSDRTVTGLDHNSTQRTVNGSSQGSETTTGSSDAGSFTATRSVSDSTQGLVIPSSTHGPTYPTAGTVTRNFTAKRTIARQEPQTITRRETITYDGSNVAKVTITINGSTKSCTKPLPRGPLSCS